MKTKICKHGHLYEIGKPCRKCQNRRSLRWNKAHPEAIRKAASDWHYRHHEQALMNTKNNHLKEYGLTAETYKEMFTRQNGRCLTCGTPLVEKKINPRQYRCIDHHHKTGQVRGLLCSKCNWALGLTNDNPETLRRMMAYLDRRPEKMLVYLAGSLKNKKIVSLANFLRENEYDVFEDWSYAGPDADDWWQKKEKERGRTYIEALKGRAAQNVFSFDKAYLDIADAVVLVSPCGKSAYMELGYSKANGKLAFAFIPRKTLKRYEVMTKFADGVFETKEELLEALNQERNKRSFKPIFVKSYLLNQLLR